MNRRHTIILIILAAAIFVISPLTLFFGSVDIPAAKVIDALTGKESTVSDEFIIWSTRLPAMLTSLFAGCALALAGLLMQTCFSNPLAGPSIMGISTGAGLGVAVVVLLFGGIVGVWGALATVAGAFAGALAVLVLLLLFSTFVHSSDVLLIIGILTGYLASSAISLLNFFSTQEAVHNFVVWGLGNFDSVDSESLIIMASMVLALTLISLFYVKSLNALLFGSAYAEGIGLRVRRVRTALILISGALTAVVTAWCGPIAFIGLVVPHMARMICRSSNHKVILPATVLCGALTGVGCRLLSVLPSEHFHAIVPINAITPVIGVPVIIYVLLNRKKILYFN